MTILVRSIYQTFCGPMASSASAAVAQSGVMATRVIINVAKVAALMKVLQPIRCYINASLD